MQLWVNTGREFSRSQGNPIPRFRDVMKVFSMYAAVQGTRAGCILPGRVSQELYSHVVLKRVKVSRGSSKLLFPVLNSPRRRPVNSHVSVEQTQSTYLRDRRHDPLGLSRTILLFDYICIARKREINGQTWARWNSNFIEVRGWKSHAVEQDILVLVV